jgi:hypothetical protein
LADSDLRFDLRARHRSPAKRRRRRFDLHRHRLSREAKEHRPPKTRMRRT